MSWKIWLFIAVALLGAGVWVVLDRLELPGDEKVVSERGSESTNITLETGGKIEQSIVAPADVYGALSLHTHEPKGSGQRFRVTVLHVDQGILAAANTYTTRYHEDNLVIEFLIPSFTVTKADRGKITVVIAQIAGPPTKLAAEYDTVNEQPQIVIGARPLGPLPEGVKRGVWAGYGVLVGVALMQLVTSRRWQWGVAGLIIFGATFFGLGGFWENPAMLGISDWDYYFTLHHVYRETIVTHDQFPHWNPYTCGGTAGLADPEFPVFTLTFLAELLFGIPIGLRIAIGLSVITGGWGLLALSKRLKMSPTAGVLVAIIGVLSTTNLLEITEGHVNVFAAMWIPWIFWAWLGAYRTHAAGEQTIRKVALLALFLSLTFYAGGIYLLMYTTLAFLVLPLLVRRPVSAILITIQAGIWAVGLAALKLIPVLLWLKQFPDEAFASSADTILYLHEIFFSRHLHGSYIIFDQVVGWHEYGAYIGYIAFALALIGISRWRHRRVIPRLTIAAVLATVLSTLGPLLRPYFDYLWFFPRSNISRIIYFAVIPLALLAGFGIDYLKSRTRTFRVVSILLVGFVAIDLLSLSYQVSQQAFVLPDVVPAPSPAPYPIGFTAKRYDPNGDDNRTTRAYAAARQGWGTYTYCSVLGPEPAVEPKEGDQEILQTQAGSYKLLAWSPNEVQAVITAPEATEVLLSTTYAHGWYINGQPAEDRASRVGTIVPAGEHIITFSFHTPGFRTGATITALTMIASILWLLKTRAIKTHVTNQASA